MISPLYSRQCPITGTWTPSRILPFQLTEAVSSGPSTLLPLKGFRSMSANRSYSAVTTVRPHLSDNGRTVESALLLWLIVRENDLKDEGARLTNSILAYLASCEAGEYNPWVRDDLRISWITVLYASNGNPIPHIEATYRVLGLHPDKVYQAILDRREALLGPPEKKQPAPVKPKAMEATA